MIHLDLPPDDPKPDVQLQEPVGAMPVQPPQELQLVPNARHIIFSWIAHEIWLCPYGITRLDGDKVVAVDWRREAVAYRLRFEPPATLNTSGQDPERVKLIATITVLRLEYQERLGVALALWDLDSFYLEPTPAARNILQHSGVLE